MTAQGVPLTWPHILAFPMHLRLMMRSDFPFPLAGLVHLHNRIRQYARLRPGEALSPHVRFGRLMSHERGQAFSILTTMGRDGVVVWGGREPLFEARRRWVRRCGAGDGSGGQNDAASVLVASWRSGASICAGVRGRQPYSYLCPWGAAVRLSARHRPWHVDPGAGAGRLTPPDGLEAAEIEVSFRTPLLLPGAAALFTAPNHRDFEVRDPTGERLHMRGRLSALAPLEIIV